MIAQHERKGEPVPDHLFPPVILEGWLEVYSAFWELSSDRAIGFSGLGPIPAASLDRWESKQVDFTAEELQIARQAFRAMDRAFMSKLNKPVTDNLNNPAIPPITPTIFDAMFSNKPPASKG